MPATMPSMARPVVTVEESLILSSGKSPVRINQRPSKSIPRFLPAKLLVSAMCVLLVPMKVKATNHVLLNFKLEFTIDK